MSSTTANTGKCTNASDKCGFGGSCQVFIAKDPEATDLTRAVCLCGCYWSQHTVVEHLKVNLIRKPIKITDYNCTFQSTTTIPKKTDSTTDGTRSTGSATLNAFKGSRGSNKGSSGFSGIFRQHADLRDERQKGAFDPTKKVCLVSL
jgi:hypothetical protein